MDLTGPNLARRESRLESYTMLTQREAEVQAREEVGMTHQEIADELDIAENKVNEHSEQILEKVERARLTLFMLPDTEEDTEE